MAGMMSRSGEAEAAAGGGEGEGEGEASAGRAPQRRRRRERKRKEWERNGRKAEDGMASLGAGGSLGLCSWALVWRELRAGRGALGCRQQRNEG